MSMSISSAFIQEFEAEVHLAYQRQGSKLKGTVRYKSGVVGSSTNFQKVGQGSASTKGRHGAIAPMNASHAMVNCPLSDYYAGDWVDALDELKTNIDERQIVAMSGAMALGRQTDALIVSALTAGVTTTVAHGGTGLDRTKVLSALWQLNSNDVPDDGDRYFVVGPQQWNNLLTVTEFVNSQYIGEVDDLPFTLGVTAKRWLGMTFFQFTGLSATATSGGVRDCWLYHRGAVGLAVGQDIKSDITWHGDHAAHFVNNMMSMGSVAIDSLGFIKVQAQEA